jgi:DNA-binding IclR family transcriptional regulator
METAQTVLRALALLEAVAEGVHDLEGLSARVGLSRSTAHRLLSTLVRAGYLRHSPRAGYRLGPRLIELGFRAHAGLHLPSLARPYLEELSEITRETVHLGVLDGTEVVYIDKVPGKRELQMASYIGARVPAQSTALGKALVSTLPPEEWLRAFVPGLRRTERTLSLIHI